MDHVMRGIMIEEVGYADFNCALPFLVTTEPFELNRLDGVPDDVRNPVRQAVREGNTIIAVGPYRYLKCKVRGGRSTSGKILPCESGRLVGRPDCSSTHAFVHAIPDSIERTQQHCAARITLER